MNKLLLIDDDKELCQLLQEYLTAESFVVDMFHDGQQAVDIPDHNKYAAIVLDVMLPTRNGFDVLKQLRQGSQTPVLMLTAKGDTIDRVIGLEIGADDYLPKPCDPRELVARVRAVLRRTANNAQALPETSDFEVDKLLLQTGSRSAFWQDTQLSLTG